MGLFDSIRRVVGGGDDGTAESDETATQPDLVETRALDESALRERADGVAGEVDVLDFSLSSLEQFDDAIDAGYDEDLATADVPGAYATDSVRFGCYLGEVLVRVYGGQWTRNPDWGVTITGPDGTTTVAVFDVAERSITTGAVFAAVADRAAVEVGLDGVPAHDADTVPADAEDNDPADAGVPTDDAGDETEATADDERPAGDPDDAKPDAPADDPGAAPSDDPLAAESGGDTPLAAESSDDTPAADTPNDEPTADTPATATDDAVAGDSTPSEADREAVDRIVEASDAESLIEEAEPAADDAAAADEPGQTGADADQGATHTDAPASSESPSGGEAGAADAPSLFGDDAAGSGPTVADAPSAADAPQAPPGPEATDAPAEGADRDDATGDASDAVPASDDPDDASDPTAGGEASATSRPSSDASASDGDDLRATYAEAAEELVSFWTEYDLDYTPESLERLDALVSEEWDDDRFDDAEFGSDDSFDDRVFTSVSTELGSYFGEVLVRELDAEWSDEATTDGVVVEGADGPLAIPVFKVAGTSITQQPVFARSYDSLLSDLNG